MANICLYKVLVKGTKKICEILLNMMPGDNHQIYKEEGTDDNFEIIFSGHCNWDVDASTIKGMVERQFTEEEIDKIDFNTAWKIPLKEKSLALGCEIFCNSKDIDASSYSEFIHYNKGEIIFDECPKELHIKRGRDYDCYDDLILTDRGLMTIDDYNGMQRKLKIITAKVKFEQGTYWYLNPDNYEVGDLVYVKGAKQDCIGKIVEIGNLYDNFAAYSITEKCGYAKEFFINEIEEIWKSYKPKARKEYLKKLGIDETTPKVKFLNIIEYRWNMFSNDGGNWTDFLETLN